IPSASGRTTTHAPTSPLPSSIPSKNEVLGVSRTIVCFRAISDPLRCSDVEIPFVRLSEDALQGECAAASDAKAVVCRNSLRLVFIADPFCRCSTTTQNRELCPSLASSLLLDSVQFEGNAVIVAGQLSFNPVVHQVGATEFDCRFGCTSFGVNSGHRVGAAFVEAF